MKTVTLLPRNNSLDALRGVAILGMVLSGSIAFGGILPAWMYHAQVPPPLHNFNPDIAGITWVDIVFPIFLFSMGAAIPMALRKWEQHPLATAQVWWIATRRLLLLTWFAIFTHHMKAWVIHPQPQQQHYFLSILAFLLLFGQLYQPRGESNNNVWKVIRGLSFIAGAALLYFLPFHEGRGFQFDKSDIIIIVLANMAFFGTIIYWYTRHNSWMRWAFLPFIMAIFFGSKLEGSWNETVFNWSPLPWMYKFYYLKYLFIVLPGTIAGEILQRKEQASVPSAVQKQVSFILLLIVVLNVWLLYQRILLPNLALTALLIGIGYWCLKPYKASTMFPLFQLGSYLLVLGLFFEAYEGGIKKDSSTYSYYLVSSGVATFMLLSFIGWQQISLGKRINTSLATNGKNPMVAYIAGSLLLIPMLHITGAVRWMEKLNSQPWLGLLKGLIFTAIVACITHFFSRRHWFWKT